MPTIVPVSDLRNYGNVLEKASVLYKSVIDAFFMFCRGLELVFSVFYI